MSNVLVIVRFRNQGVHVLEIIALVQAQMLFTGRTRDHDRDEQVIDRPFVVLIGARDVHRQRCQLSDVTSPPLFGERSHAVFGQTPQGRFRPKVTTLIC